MAKKNCSKCDKEIGWLSQNKIDGALYCDDCSKELNKAKKGAKKGEKKGEKKAAKEEDKQRKKAAKEEGKQRKASASRAGGSGASVQNFVLVATAFTLALILLFPPFYCIHGGEKVSMGNFAIFSPPALPTRNMQAGFVASIDTFVLLVQYLFVVTIGGVLWFALQKKEARADPSLPQQNTTEIEPLDGNDLKDRSEKGKE